MSGDPTAEDIDPANNPAFWAESTDPKSGKKYYYNKKTKQTSWKKPPCMGGAVKAAPQWVEAKDQKTGKTYFYEKTTKQVRWDKPKEESDWKEATAPETGRTYWYNKVTKKTTWKNPHLSPEEAAKEAQKEKAKTSPEASNASAARDSAAAMSSDVADDSGGDDEDEEEESHRLKQVQRLKGAEDTTEVDDDDFDDEGSDDDSAHEDFKFAKHRKGWLKRTFRLGDHQNDSQLLTFKKSLIKKALLKQNRDLDTDAVQAFKNVMSYMGDRKSSKAPVDHARKLLKNIMIAPIGIRDELYMQICKQTTENPRIASTIKGWELMVFCVATFPPSKNLKHFLMDFIKKTISDNVNERVTALAEFCLRNMSKIGLLGQRKQVPSKLEISCLIELKPIPIRVKLSNDTFKTHQVDSYSLVQEVLDRMNDMHNLTVKAPFALYEAAEANVERILDPKDRICDVIGSWENRDFAEEPEESKKQQTKRNTKFDQHKDANKKVKKVEANYNSFLYKAKLVLKTTNKEIKFDEEAVNLIYIQATQDVVTNRYPAKEKDITVLAALQLQAAFGDKNESLYVKGWLAPKIYEYIPKHLTVNKKGTVQEDKVVSWETNILQKYSKLAGFTQLDAKLNYLDYVQEWTFYGATFFEVEQRQFKDYPSPLTLGINCEGVLLMHPEKKTVLENYDFTAIVTWGHSDEKFIVVVGNILQQRKLIFKTKQGKHMNHLIHDYVKFKVKSKV